MSNVPARHRDGVLEGFLQLQIQEGLDLAESSDIMELVPLESPPCTRYRATFRCQTLVQNGEGVTEEACQSTVDIWFPSQYLRQADTFTVLSWRGPRTIFHPNINANAGVICIGTLHPGTRLVDILYQIYELLIWRNIQMNERDALDFRACDWARRNQQRYPLVERPLTRPRVQSDLRKENLG